MGLIWALVHWGAIDFSQVELSGRTAWWLLAAFFFLLLSIPISAWRWQLLLRAQDIDLSFFQSLRLTGIALFSNTFLPGGLGGDAVRAALVIRRLKSARTRALVSVLVDRLCGALGLIVLGVFAVLSHLGRVLSQPDLILLSAGLVVLLVGGLVVVLVGLWVMGRWQVTERLDHWRDARGLRAYLWQVLFAISSYRELPGVLFAALGLSFVNHACGVFALVLVAWATAIGGLSAWDYWLITPYTFLVNWLPIAPGGLGVGEAAFDQLCQLIAGGAAAGAAYGTIFLTYRIVAAAVAVPGLIVFLTERSAIPTQEDEASPSRDPEPSSPRLG